MRQGKHDERKQDKSGKSKWVRLLVTSVLLLVCRPPMSAGTAHSEAVKALFHRATEQHGDAKRLEKLSEHKFLLQ